MDILAVGFYEYTRIYREISVEILTNKSKEEILREKKKEKTRNNTHIYILFLIFDNKLIIYRT